MNETTRREAFNAYNKVMDTAQKIFQVLWEVAENKSISVRTLTNEFEGLLQYSMMQVALADGDFDIEEVKLIRDLSDSFDFCDFLNQKNYKNVTWQMIYNTDEETLQSIIDDYRDEMINYKNNISTTFAIVDAGVTQVDFLEILKDNTLTLLCCLASADGDFNKSEIINSHCLILDTIYDMEQHKNNFLARKNNSLTRQSGAANNSPKSLKDFYVKKN